MTRTRCRTESTSWPGRSCGTSCSNSKVGRDETLAASPTVSVLLFIYFSSKSSSMQDAAPGRPSWPKASTWRPGSSSTRWDPNTRASTGRRPRAPSTAATGTSCSWLRKCGAGPHAALRHQEHCSTPAFWQKFRLLLLLLLTGAKFNETPDFKKTTRKW